jgi:predicted NBD/HSP70 family sugar kinase
MRCAVAKTTKGREPTPGPVSAPGRDRYSGVRRLIGEMEAAELIAEGQFNALGMLVTDASLAADEPALEAAHDGLQWLYRRHAAPTESDAAQAEQRGRLLGMIDVTHWALRRLPSGLQVGLDPSSHAGRFLLAVAAQPGLSNQELAARLGVDETEASRIGRRLLAAGVVWRRKQWRRNAWDITPRGRDYLTSLGLADADAKAPEPELAVGIKMLPHTLVGTVVDTDARPLAFKERQLQSGEPAGQVSEVAGLVRDLIANAPGSEEQAPDRIGLGVEVGGHVSTHSGKVVFAPSYGPRDAWTDLALRQALQEATALPTIIENDANAIAEYEHDFGEGKDIDSFAVIVLDEGIGCGLFTHGRLIHGIHEMAGEIGHIVVQPDGRTCRCGNKGCLDSVASTLAITQIFEELSGRDGPDVPDLPNVVAHFDQHDKYAVTAIEKAGDALGRAISAVLNLTNPEKLVLYGPDELVCESSHAAAREFMAHVRESSQKYTFSTAARDCTLIPKTFGYEVGAKAAAAVALLSSKEQSEVAESVLIKS